MHADPERDGVARADGPGHAQGARADVHRPQHARGPRGEGKVVILCAQALESTRILLNSATEQEPNGLANSSGVLGHYLMDHLWVAGGAAASSPISRASLAGHGTAANGIYVIRFRNPMKGQRHKDFLRGYGFQGGGAVQFDFAAPGFGEEYKQKLKSGMSTVRFAGFGECLPCVDNHVAIDQNVSDIYGIPVLRISMTWGENERR